MSSSLLLDLGNHSLKAGFAKEGNVDFFGVWPADEAGIASFLSDCSKRFSGERRVLLASVNPTARESLLSALPSTMVCSEVLPEDVPLRRTTSGTGVDRLLAAWWAWQQVRRESQEMPLAVADCGTAFTLDYVDEGGVFRGGAIGPGLGLQIQALEAACPHLDTPSSCPDEWPDTTSKATAYGTYAALALALEGLAHRFSSNAHLFLTGGDAEKLRPWLTSSWSVHSHLVLRALSSLEQIQS